jgi:hypothetical protein
MEKDKKLAQDPISRICQTTTLINQVHTLYFPSLVLYSLLQHLLRHWELEEQNAQSPSKLVGGEGEGTVPPPEQYSEVVPHHPH